MERQRIKDGKPYTHTRIAHDDISINVNWETRSDRRLAQLNCAISADIRSGYVFRCDVDFDPTVDPLDTVEDHYFGPSKSVSLRRQYRNSKETFTAPLMHFQRPTARFDEPALFAAAIGKLNRFVLSHGYPRLWLRSPVPRANEIDKVVGFPILSPRYRAEYRELDIDDAIQNPKLRAAITRRMTMATLQPVSTFQNVLQKRVSIVERAGGGSARKGSSYVNGSACNPRVLIAMLNIWRIYYNFFDWPTYTSPDEDEKTAPEKDESTTQDKDEGTIASGDARAVRRLKVPGAN